MNHNVHMATPASLRGFVATAAPGDTMVYLYGRASEIYSPYCARMAIPLLASARAIWESGVAELFQEVVLRDKPDDPVREYRLIKRETPAGPRKLNISEPQTRPQSVRQARAARKRAREEAALKAAFKEEK